jgi:nucleoside 2-deoxyribosyltransferase
MQMSQVGISRDYCALVGGPCSEALSATEELDAFIAYPDEAPIDHDMRMAKEAAEKRGYRVATWQDFAGESQIIFCKVCKAISSSQALWAEVTRASANVYFEIGYALALGKHLRLFCVPSKDPEKIPMIEDVLYFPYENVDELVNRALEETTESPLAERLQANAIEKRGGLHTLLMRRAYRMEAAQSIFKLLHRKLTPLQVNVKIDDPSELSGHDLFELTSLAANSRFVVVNMASSDRKRSRAENAGAALIAGYALGSSRRLLVLQEKPADPMLDLRGVRKEYSDAKEATQLLETWLDDVMPDVSSTADDHRQHRKRGAARIERWALNLGHPAAEYDPLLKECFTQNAAYNAAISGQRYLFVGRKGAGKTANCILLQSALEDGGTAVVRMIAPERMQLDGMIQEVANALDEIPDPAVLKAMWRHVLCTEIAATILREDADKPHPETAQAARRIADVLDTLAIRPDASFDTRLSECLQGLVDLHTSPHLTRPELLQAFHTREVAELLALLKTLELPIQVFLLIDNLDQDWRAEDTGLTAALINALVDEAQRLSHKELPGLAHIVVFLRTDIYEVARRQDPDADKKTPVHLRWDMESLFDLITQRLAAMLRTSGQVPPGEPEMIWH